MSARILQQNSYRQWGTKIPFYARVSTMSPQKSCDIFCHNKHTSIPERVMRKMIGCWGPTVMARKTHRAMLDAMLDLPPTAAYTPLLQVRSCISNLDVQYNYAGRFLNCFSSSAHCPCPSCLALAFSCPPPISGGFFPLLTHSALCFACVGCTLEVKGNKLQINYALLWLQI